MKTVQPITRRHLLQQMTTIVLGTCAIPAISAAQEYKKRKIEIPNASTIYIAPNEGKRGQIGNMDIVFKLNKQQTNGYAGIWESVIQPGELGAPPHYHSTYDEICQVKEGSVFIMTGDVVTEVKAGGWHLRPKGTVHTFWNSGNIPAKTIDICIPGGHEDYMQELAILFENNRRPKQEDFKHLSEKHDIHYRFDILESIVKKYKVNL
ncbi:MAG: cupin domain-containing protein [Bacteroidetes bacterium]|nr:cupin domain-containing protein [Bacteroidota bacterium]